MNLLLLSNYPWFDMQWIAVILVFIASVLDVIDYDRVKSRGEKRSGFLNLENRVCRYIAKFSFLIGAVVFLAACLFYSGYEGTGVVFVANMLLAFCLEIVLGFLLYLAIVLGTTLLYRLMKWIYGVVSRLCRWLIE